MTKFMIVLYENCNEEVKIKLKENKISVVFESSIFPDRIFVKTKLKEEDVSALLFVKNIILL